MVNGGLGGIITFQQWTPVSGELHIICRRDCWGKDRTDAAAALAIHSVFASGYHKVMGVAFGSNRQVRGMLNRLGFKREGILRKHTQRQGRMVDVVLFGMTREEYEKKWPCYLVDKLPAAL